MSAATVPHAAGRCASGTAPPSASATGEKEEAGIRENVGGADCVLRSVAVPSLLCAAPGPLDAPHGRLLGRAALVAGTLVTEAATSRVCPVSAWLGFLDSSR